MSAVVHRVEMAMLVIVEPAPHGRPGFVYRIELDGHEISAGSSAAYNTEADAFRSAKLAIPKLAEYQIRRAERKAMI